MISNIVGTDIQKSPIYATDKNLSTNSDFIWDYIGGLSDDFSLMIFIRERVKSSDIFMTEDIYVLIGDSFWYAEEAWKAFYNKMNQLKECLGEQNEDVFIKKYHSYLSEFKPFDQKIELWSDFIWDIKVIKNVH